jgi:DNA-directed RNA polymerase specialized sigma24 family protein
LIAGQQEERRLLAALRSLPIEQQILLELFYWESMQGPELAELYELPEGTIRTRLRTARLRLVEAFAQLEGAGADANESTSLEAWARGIRERLGDAQGDAKVKE